MHEPEVYAKANKHQIDDADMALRSYGQAMRPLTAGDRVLDIGCGVGNVTRDILMPTCGQADFLLGIDISPNMVEYASAHFRQDRLFYRQMDIINKEECKDILKEFGPFARIYSFYCLQWIMNLTKVLRNIASLLSNDGDCFFLFPICAPVYEMYKTVYQLPKWKPYMQNINDIIPDYLYSKNLSEDFTEMMKNAGLQVLTCQAKEMCLTLNSDQELKGFLRSINAFIKHVPQQMKEDYIQDSLEIFNQMTANSLAVHYKLLIAHARQNLPCDTISSCN